MNQGLFGILALALVAFVVLRLARVYSRLHGRRLIICPETHRPAAVDLNAMRAALTSLVETPALRLHDCSRWPERAGCGEECLQQIEAAPTDCLVRTLLAQYYRGAVCSLCGKPIRKIHSSGMKPAFLAPSGRVVTWSDVRAEDLPSVFTDHKPVCAGCDVAEAFRREFPGMVSDREEGRAAVRNRLVH